METVRTENREYRTPIKTQNEDAKKKSGISKFYK